MDLTAHFQALLSRPSVDGDFYYPHIVWMAMEPRIAADPRPFLPLLGANANGVSAYCAHRMMRRIADLTNASARAEYLNEAFRWLGSIATKSALAEAALDGLIEAQKSKGAPPTLDVQPIFARLTANPAIANKAQRLAAALGDQHAAQLLIARINDPQTSTDDRLRGIAAAREAGSDAAREALLKLIREPLSLPSASATQLKSEAVQALAATGGSDAANQIIDHWKELPLPSRIVAAESLVHGTKPARALLAAIEKRIVAANEISATARRALAQSEEATVADQAMRLLGRYRKSSAEKLKLIEDKKLAILSAKPDVDNGHQLARTACFVCHKLYGEGADVGPDLTGVGRSSLEALLHNVIDPNEVIGNGYEATEVKLTDDTTLTGRVVEETETRIKLLASGPTEYTIAKKDIKSVDGKLAIRKLDLSLMPEGLEQMPEKDFRDLIMFILHPPQEQGGTSSK